MKDIEKRLRNGIADFSQSAPDGLEKRILDRLSDKQIIKIKSHPVRKYLLAVASLAVACLITILYFNWQTNHTQIDFEEEIAAFNNLSDKIKPLNWPENFQDQYDKELLVVMTDLENGSQNILSCLPTSFLLDSTLTNPNQ